MTLSKLVWFEIRERPWALATSLLAILLGVASLVAIRHITHASEQQVAQRMAALGANVLILPKTASVQDYYGADLNGAALPEEYASRVLLANLAGVEKLSPRYCTSTTVRETPVTITGILPQSEFEAKAVWQSTGMFAKKKHVGCKKAACEPSPEDRSPEALARQRTIAELGEHDVVAGVEVADALNLQTGSRVTLFGEQFRAVAVLPRTGTVDDSRLFAHLHTVQRLADSGEVVSAIEVLACCDDAAGELVSQLAALLPDARVMTISHVVQAQVGVNRLLGRVSLFILAVLVVVGGATVASSIASNVRERRREIGTLLALGARPRWVAALFLLKALLVGISGGVLGAGLGVGVAWVLGPAWAGVAITPLPWLLATGAAAAVLVCLVAAYFPARGAAQLDPCLCFQEV